MPMDITTNRPMSGLPNRQIHLGMPITMMASDPHIIFLIYRHHFNIISAQTPMGFHLTSVCRLHRTDHKITVLCRSLPRCITRALCTTSSLFTTMARRTTTSTRHCLRLIRVCALIRIPQDHRRTIYLLPLHLITPQESLRRTTGDKTDSHLHQ
jgi:hypothetical protein